MTYKLFAGKIPNSSESVISVIRGSHFNNAVGIEGVESGEVAQDWSASLHKPHVVFDSRASYMRKWYEGYNVPLSLAAKAAGTQVVTHVLGQVSCTLQDGVPIFVGKLSTDPSFGVIIPSFDNTRSSGSVGHSRFLSFAAAADLVSGQDYLVSMYAIEHYAGQSAPAVNINVDVVLMGK